MVKLNTITTKTGDNGTTGLGDGSRVSKRSLRIEAIGAVDELNAALGVARLRTTPEIDDHISRVQNDLFDMGADLCMPKTGEGQLRITQQQVASLEAAQEDINRALKPLTSFVLPGGAVDAALLHVARTAARRAERSIVALHEAEPLNPDLLRYINRLSDFLFVLARYANAGDDVLWVPGQNR